jgi:hypothetical protein
MERIKYKNYLLFIIILVVLGVFFIVIYPQVDKIKNNNEKISEEKIKLKKNIETDKKINKFHLKKENYDSFQNNLKTALIENKNKLDLIIPLENIARELNLRQNLEIVENEEKRTSKEEEKSALEKLEGQQVRLQLEGDYKNILKYFIKLNELGLMYEIIGLQINQKGFSEEFQKDQDEANQGITQALFEIKFFTK